MDFPAPIVPNYMPELSINTLGSNSLGNGLLTGTAFAGNGWPASSRALFVPFRLAFPATVYQMACGTGTGTTGNFDLGIYDSGGNKIVSTGSTAKTTASSERIVNITDTLLLPGLYYLAMATDGTTNYLSVVPGNLGFCKLLGMRQMASAFALPTTATYATMSTAYLPAISAYLRSE